MISRSLTVAVYEPAVPSNVAINIFGFLDNSLSPVSDIVSSSHELEMICVL
jgi:hypothetical protein